MGGAAHGRARNLPCSGRDRLGCATITPTWYHVGINHVGSHAGGIGATAPEGAGHRCAAAIQSDRFIASASSRHALINPRSEPLRPAELSGCAARRLRAYEQVRGTIRPLIRACDPHRKRARRLYSVPAAAGATYLTRLQLAIDLDRRLARPHQLQRHDQASLAFWKCTGRQRCCETRLIARRANLPPADVADPVGLPFVDACDQREMLNARACRHAAPSRRARCRHRQQNTVDAPRRTDRRRQPAASAAWVSSAKLQATPTNHARLRSVARSAR